MNLDPPIPRLERLRRAGDPDGPTSVDRRSGDAPTGRRSRAGPGAVRRERHQADYVILVVVVALTAVGILMVYSSSALKGYLSQDADTFATVGPQIQWAILGLVAMAVMMRVDYRYLRLASVPLYIVADRAAGAGLRAAAQHRDRRLGALAQARSAARRSTRPSSPSSPLIIYLAHWFAKRGKRVHGFWAGTVPFLIIVGPIIALVFKEPDLGTTIVITLTVFTMFFLAGANLVHLAVMVGGAGLARHHGRPAGLPARPDPGLAGPVAGPAGQGLPHGPGPARARASAACSGPGSGNSRVSVPNAFNDFIFAEVGQEFGMIGAIVVITLFLLLAYSGVRVALAAPGHVRGAAGRRHHRLAVPPGVHQHRGRGGPAADHRDHAAVHQRRRLIPHHQLRGGRDPPLDLAGDRRKGDVERRCDC